MQAVSEAPNDSDLQQQQVLQQAQKPPPVSQDGGDPEPDLPREHLECEVTHEEELQTQG